MVLEKLIEKKDLTDSCQLASVSKAEDGDWEDVKPGVAKYEQLIRSLRRMVKRHRADVISCSAPNQTSSRTIREPMDASGAHG